MHCVTVTMNSQQLPGFYHSSFNRINSLRVITKNTLNIVKLENKKTQFLSNNFYFFFIIKYITEIKEKKNNKQILK